MAERIGAFFDFDETLLDTESSRLGIKYLWERRLVSRVFILKAFVAGFLYKRHWITDEQTAKILLRLYRNRRLVEFTDGSEVFYREILKPRLAPKILAKVYEHRRSGTLPGAHIRFDQIHARTGGPGPRIRAPVVHGSGSRRQWIAHRETQRPPVPGYNQTPSRHRTGPTHRNRSGALLCLWQSSSRPAVA